MSRTWHVKTHNTTEPVVILWKMRNRKSSSLTILKRWLHKPDSWEYFLVTQVKYAWTENMVICFFLNLLSFVETKLSLTRLSTFNEGVPNIQELLSLRKGINLHLQEIKMDYPEKTKRQSFLPVKTNNCPQFQRKPSVKSTQ